MRHMADTQNHKLLLPRAVLISHAVVAALTVTWGYLDSHGSPAAAYFKLSYSLGLPRVVGNLLEVFIFFFSILLFPIVAAIVLFLKRFSLRATLPYVGAHCCFSVVQFFGFLPLVA